MMTFKKVSLYIFDKSNIQALDTYFILKQHLRGTFVIIKGDQI